MNRIKEIRKAQKLSQKQLSDMTGLSQVCLSRSECGQRGLDLEDAYVIAAALGCSVDDLIAKNDKER